MDANAPAAMIGRRSLTADTKLDMCRFAESDQDGDRILQFEDFVLMMPPDLRSSFSRSQIKSWFDAADVDGGGALSIHDYWRWSLRNVLLKHGLDDLEAAFTKYDKDGTGFLDALEFEKVATDMGFGNVSHEIFRDLDDDGSGYITYTELLQNLNEQNAAAVNVDADTAALHERIRAAYDEQTKEKRVVHVDISGWTLKGRDPPTVLAELRDFLASSKAHIVDLIKVFDDDADMKLCVDEMEFMKTLQKRLGYKGPTGVLQQVFKQLDTDSSGAISYDDLFEFVRRRKHALDTRKSPMPMRLEPLPQPMPAYGGEQSPGGQPGAAASSSSSASSLTRPTLSEINWDPETLRTLVKQMLEVANRGTTDLLKAWDTSTSDTRGKHTLNRAEFVEHMGAFFKDEHPDLWQSEVKAVTEAAFDGILREVKGGNLLRSLTVVHLEKWLDDAPRMAHLPLKSKSQLKKMRTRREKLDAPVVVVPSPPRVDQDAIAQEGIKHARARARMLADAKDFTTRQRWEASQANASLATRFEIARGKITMPSWQHLETPSALLDLPPAKARIYMRARKGGKGSGQSAYLVGSRSLSSLPPLPRSRSLHRLEAGHSMASLVIRRNGGHAEKFYETHSLRELNFERRYRMI